MSAAPTRKLPGKLIGKLKRASHQTSGWGIEVQGSETLYTVSNSIIQSFLRLKTIEDFADYENRYISFFAGRRGAVNELQLVNAPVLSPPRIQPPSQTVRTAVIPSHQTKQRPVGVLSMNDGGRSHWGILMADGEMRSLAIDEVRVSLKDRQEQDPHKYVGKKFTFVARAHAGAGDLKLVEEAPSGNRTPGPESHHRDNANHHPAEGPALRSMTSSPLQPAYKELHISSNDAYLQVGYALLGRTMLAQVCVEKLQPPDWPKKLYLDIPIYLGSALHPCKYAIRHEIPQEMCNYYGQRVDWWYTLSLTTAIQDGLLLENIHHFATADQLKASPQLRDEQNRRLKAQDTDLQYIANAWVQQQWTMQY